MALPESNRIVSPISRPHYSSPEWLPKYLFSTTSCFIGLEQGNGQKGGRGIWTHTESIFTEVPLFYGTCSITLKKQGDKRQKTFSYSIHWATLPVCHLSIVEVAGFEPATRA